MLNDTQTVSTCSQNVGCGRHGQSWRSMLKHTIDMLYLPELCDCQNSFPWSLGNHIRKPNNQDLLALAVLLMHAWFKVLLMNEFSAILVIQVCGEWFTDLDCSCCKLPARSPILLLIRSWPNPVEYIRSISFQEHFKWTVVQQIISCSSTWLVMSISISPLNLAQSFDHTDLSLWQVITFSHCTITTMNTFSRLTRFFIFIIYCLHMCTILSCKYWSKYGKIFKIYKMYKN